MTLFKSNQKTTQKLNQESQPVVVICFLLAVLSAVHSSAQVQMFGDGESKTLEAELNVFFSNTPRPYLMHFLLNLLSST